MPWAMRAILLALLLIGCTKSESASPSAKSAPAPEPVATAQQPGAIALPQTPPAVPPAAVAEAEGTCGGGGSCCGGAGDVETAAIPSDAPANAAWSTLNVSMRCGKCAKKIMAALGKVEGVIAVQADADSDQVRWAVGQGHADNRDAVIAEIRKLGYQPQL
jgi:copper chaperone CopZ